MIDSNDIGTSANQLLKLDGTAKIPAADGSLLTGLPASFTSSASDPVITTNPSGGVGTIWKNTTSGEVYCCTNATAGSNVWTNIGAGTGDIAPSTLPRQGTQYGYHCGGTAPARINMIQKYSFTSDANSVDTTADLTDVGSSGSGNVGSLTHGYCAGHQNASVNTNIIEKFPFASSSNATDVGNLAHLIYGGMGCATQTYGYVQGGGQGSSTPRNEIQRFSFSSDGNAVDVGDITVARGHGAGTMSETYGYAHGGQNPGSGYSTWGNVIDKFAFGSSATSTDVGDILTDAIYLTGHQSVTHGYWAGGMISNIPPSTHPPYCTEIIAKYSFSSDGNAVDVANMIPANGIAFGAGSTQTDYGYVSGGQRATDMASQDTIQKFSFPAGTNATDVANLVANNHGAFGCQF